MPTYIYSKPVDFYRYAMDKYYQQHNLPLSNQSFEQCSLADPQCQALEIPLTNQENNTNATCLNDPFTASSCCSLHTETFFVDSSHKNENDWTKYLIDFFDGTVS